MLRTCLALAVVSIACTTPTSDHGGPTGPDGAVSPGSDGSGPDAAAPPDPPIAPTAFVLATAPPTGSPKLYAHDVTTNATTLLSTLDDDSTVSAVALSHDRKTIAFTGLFRPTQTEIAAGYLAESLWVVGTSGTSFRRVTDPLPTQVPPGALFHITMPNPTWAPDDGSLFFQFAQQWESGTMFYGSYDLAQTPLGGGIPNLWTAGQGDCLEAGPIAFTPDGAHTAFLRSVCVHDAEVGLYTLAGSTITEVLPSTAFSDGLVWLSDGSGLIVDAYDGLHAVAMPTAVDKGVIPLPQPNYYILSFAIDPSERYLVACVSAGATKKLYLFDSAASPPAWTEQPGLVSESCAVTW